MSKKGITAKKNEDFSEWYTQVCSPEGAGLADNRYDVKGAIVHLPWGYKIARNVYRLLEEKVEEQGHEPFLFPVFTHKRNLDREEEHSGFAPEVFWVTEAGSNELDVPLALRPTGETQIYPMYSKWLRSHGQLPMKYYQSRHMAYRYETHSRPFLRGREFMFFETHNMFETHEEAEQSIHNDLDVINEVMGNKLHLPFKFFKRPSWDAFLGANATYVADTIMPDGKRNQMSSTHDLGTNFAEAFDVTYADKEGEQQHPFQTCFGPGIWRIIASIIGIHGDDTGLILPLSVAPKDVVITPILFDDTEVNNKILDISKSIKEDLDAYNVVIDDSDKHPGWKFNQWEMKGVPHRIEIGPRDVENEKAVIASRFGGKRSVAITEVRTALHEERRKYSEAMEERSKTYVKNRTMTATSLDEVREGIEQGTGFVKAPFLDIDGEAAQKAADTLQEEVPGAQVCGVEIDAKRGTDETCIVTGEPAQHWVYIAKSY